MHKFFGAVLCGLTIGSAFPAAAVPLTELQAMCLGNPKCSIMPNSNGQDFCIASDKPGGSRCEKMVSCWGDDSSQCAVIGITGNGRRRPIPNIGAESILEAPLR